VGMVPTGAPGGRRSSKVSTSDAVSSRHCAANGVADRQRFSFSPERRRAWWGSSGSRLSRFGQLGLFRQRRPTHVERRRMRTSGRSLAPGCGPGAGQRRQCERACWACGLRVSGEGIEVNWQQASSTATMMVKDTPKRRRCGTGETSAPVRDPGLGRG
jgi:hypothetical protein